MRIFKHLLLASCALALLAMLAPGARASAWDQRVIATFSGPVEIPGQVLPTGTYVIKVLDVVGSRDVVQVTNADESKVLATAFTIARYRSTPTSKPVFVMQERGANSPQALQAWYYPGFVDGHQFVYSTPVQLTAMTNTAPIPTPTNEAAAIPSAAPAPEESSPVMSAEATTTEPTPDEMAQSNQNTDQNQMAQAQTATQPSNSSTTQTNNELPKTASATPLIGLIGMLLMGAALGLKALGSRVS